MTSSFTTRSIFLNWDRFLLFQRSLVVFKNYNMGELLFQKRGST